MSQSVVVPHRERGASIEELGMSSDNKDIPSPLDGSEPVGWWIAGTSGFIGEKAARLTDGQLGGVEPYAAAGLTCLAVTADDRVLAILCPNGDGEQKTQTLWLSWELADLEITTEGSLGLLKKRPQKFNLKVKSNENELILAVVSRLWRSSGIQKGQENSLAKALGVSR